MEQCPICLRVFAAPKYLVSHLHQSARCSARLTNDGTTMASPYSNTLVGVIQPLCSSVKTSTPNNDFVQRPFVTNIFGDTIVPEDDEHSNGFQDFGEVEDDPTTDEPEANQFHGNNVTDASVPGDTANNEIYTIQDNESFNVPPVSDDRLHSMLRLIKTIRDSGAPLSLLDSIVKILKEDSQAGRLDVTTLCSHKTAIRRITKLFPSLPTPIPVTITHERTLKEMSSGAPRSSLTFPKFSFLGQFLDLVDHHVFSDLENLVVDPDHCWDFYARNSCPHASDEIQDGNWFQGIVEKVRNNHSSSSSIKDFIFGIQGYVDKTGTDAYQRTAVEPFMITLTLFTNRIRNSDKFWRVLALLPASLNQKQRKKHTFGASVRNYHIALREAFSDFIELQRNPPIIRLRLGDQFQYVRAHFYWINTIADGLANESLTGRIQNRTSSPRLSRGCHCPQHLADQSSLRCNLLKQAAIEKLTVAALGPSSDNQEWDDYLQSLGTAKDRRHAEAALKMRKKIAESILKNVFGQHVVDLVWFHVDQGPDPRGCFGSTPVDPMHVFEEGIVPNIMSVILDALTETAKSSLDALALNIISCNRWDSDYPRMNFTGGFSSLTQLTADEKVGKMLLLLIIMQTPLGNDIIETRCSPTFDAQRVSRATRFRSQNLDQEEANIETESDNESTLSSGRRYYTGTAGQLLNVNNCLQEHALHFVIPWIQEMHPCHQEITRKTIFDIDCARGKGGSHILPQESYLDRHEVHETVPSMYHQQETTFTEPGGESTASLEAQYSIDCTCAELKDLLEILLSFHAAYKYADQKESANFGRNVRMMMSMIKQRVNRGKDTKNWSISKFHELLHMEIDSKNFGSHANIDAGKGEHGLKKWAKLPSRTVRTREANLYYQDMARRIYENRLIELATETCLPQKVLTSNEITGIDVMGGNTEVVVEIGLTGLLMRLDVTGTSLLQPELTAFLRTRSNLSYPVNIYQEANYSINGVHHTTIRGTPNYRNSGPWTSFVLVTYEDEKGTRREYPFQVFGFFTVNEGEQQIKSAVGRMGLKKFERSRLIDEWTYERHYRVVDLETTSRVVFALTIPEKCFHDNGTSVPHRMMLLKERVSEWPSIFNGTTWRNNSKSQGNKRKRKSKR